MAKYHFSVLFEGSVIPYHGEVETAFKNTTDIIDKAKTVLSNKLGLWNRKPETITRFEVYQQINDGEVQIFLYEKK